MFWNLFLSHPLETIVELLVIGVCVFFALRFLQGTRGGGVIRGLIVLIVPLAILVALANTSEHFERLNFFAEQFVTSVFLLLIIILELFKDGQIIFYRGCVHHTGRRPVPPNVHFDFKITPLCRYLGHRDHKTL